MAYKLDVDNPPDQSVPILAARMLRDAHLAIDSSEDTDAKVHVIRKQMKKLRALLKLIRSGIDPEIYTRDNQHLRQIAHDLAPYRDTLVRSEMLRSIQNKLPASMVESIDLLYSQEAGNKPTFDESEKTTAINHIESGLLDVFRSIQSWQPGRKRINAFRSSLKKSYKQAREAYRTVDKSHSGQAFHELRKKSKYLRYQFQMLREFRPAFFKGYEKMLKELTEVLGEEHDLYELKTWLSEDRITTSLDEEEARLLACIIAQKRSELQQRVFTLCPGVFFDKPSDFIRRVEAATL